MPFHTTKPGRKARALTAASYRSLSEPAVCSCEYPFGPDHRARHQHPLLTPAIDVRHLHHVTTIGQVRLGVGFLILAGVCWGTAGTLGTLLVRATGLPFAAVAGYRIAIGGALMLAMILVRRSAVWPATAAAWRRVALIGGCLLGFQVCFFAAVSQVGVSVATLVAIGS
ncbi:MAG TPA: hypothetical protein DEG88_05205, partial [Propionibacteriaceae bacterium]|nr:hypothetical protein [Propionibacteriaceae bacterium]